MSSASAIDDPNATKLIEPCPDFEASYRAYIAELGNEVRYPFPLDFDHSTASRRFMYTASNTTRLRRA